MASPNVFTVYSPKQVCYNISDVALNFSLTAHVIETIAYSLDNGGLQNIETIYSTGADDFFVPFLNNSETNQLTVTGNLVFENLPNGNHTLRLFQGHESLGQFEVDAFTEVNFSVKAPAVFLIQRQDCYTDGNVALQLLVSEPAGLIYSLDNQENVTLSGNATLTGLSSGYHNVTVYAFNGGGNWCASNTIDFEVLPHAADSCSDGTAGISQQSAEFPYLIVVVFFAVLICCMFPVIRYLEKVNEETEKQK